MRIAMVVSNPATFDSRVLSEARALMNAGHQVEVIAWDRARRFPRSEQIHDVPIIRLRLSFAHRYIPFWPYQIQRFWNIATKYIQKGHYQIVHCHDLDTVPVGIRIKKKHSCLLVYDAHEILPLLLKRGRSIVLEPAFSALDRKAAKYVDLLLVAEEKYNDYFQLMGYSPGTVVLNCKAFSNLHYQPPTQKRFTLNYIGTLSKSRFIVEQMEVISQLPDVDLVIAGRGALEDHVRKTAESIPNIHFLGMIDPKGIIPLMQETHVTLCMINPSDQNNRIASANKQFESMAAGRPIITTQGTRSGDITIACQSGISIPYQKQALHNAIMDLKQNPSLCRTYGENGLKAAIETYNWPLQKERLIQAYQKLELSI